MHRIKKAFLSVAGASLLTLTGSFNSQAQTFSARDTNTMEQSVEVHAINDNQQVSAKFDYAFGDQVAKSMNLPGASGDNWGPQALYRALRDFNEKNPGKLKGKNIFIAIEDATLLGAMIYIPKITALIEEIKPAHVVVMGVSETRTDLDGKDANRQLKEYVEKHHCIYGGPILCAGTVNQGIYVTSAECFSAIKKQAEESLQKKVNAEKPAVAPAPGFKIAPGR